MALEPRFILHTGPMFSEKTTHMVADARKHEYANHHVLFFKPLMDDRYSNGRIINHRERVVYQKLCESLSLKSDSQQAKELYEHFGVAAHNIQTVEDIVEKLPPNPCVLGFDEMNFFPADCLELVTDLRQKGFTIYGSALDADYKQQPFVFPGQDEIKVSQRRNIGSLMAIANSVHKHSAVCIYGVQFDQKPCGSLDAQFSLALGDMGKSHINVGGAEKYIPVCGSCYNKAMK